MSDERSARLALPYLYSGQAQKETMHNEALALLDLAVQPVVVAVGVNAPPAAPVEGTCWIVGTVPTGAWSGQAGTLAGWTAGGWRFVPATDGAVVWSLADAVTARRVAGVWTIGVVAARRVEISGVQVVGARRAAISDASGGTVIDVQARATIAAMLAMLRGHGLIAP